MVICQHRSNVHPSSGTVASRRLRAEAPTMTLDLWQLLYHLRDRADGESGQTMAEYGILIAVIAIIVVVAATLLGGSISSLFNSTSGSL